MLSETEPRHVPPLAARRAQAEGPRTVLHSRMSAGPALQPETHARRHLGSRENSGTTTCFPIKIGAAAGGRKRLQRGQRALPRGGCPAPVPPAPSLRGGSGRGRQGEEPRSRLPPGARPRSHQPLSTQGIVSGVGTSGLPQGQSRVAVVWVPGPSVAPLLTSRGEAVPGQQRGAAAGRAAKFAAAGPPAGPAQQRWAGAQACLTHRRVHRGGAGTGGGEYEPWPVRRVGGREGTSSGGGSGHRRRGSGEAEESRARSPPCTSTCGLS